MRPRRLLPLGLLGLSSLAAAPRRAFSRGALRPARLEGRTALGQVPAPYSALPSLTASAGKGARGCSTGPLCFFALGSAAWSVGRERRASRRSTARRAQEDRGILETVEQIWRNAGEGEFGTRGEGYVAAQVFLVLCILGGGLPVLGDWLFVIVGPLAILAGAGMVAAAIYELGPSLTPWVKPPSECEIRTAGIYEFVRHPIYGGLLLLCLGGSMVSNSAVRLLLTFALYFVLSVKADKEENQLEQRDASYSKYKEAVPGKFLPDISRFS